MKAPARATNPVSVGLAVLAVVLVVAALAILAAAGHFAAGQGDDTSPGKLLAPLRISTQATAQLSCPSSAAFSPDGAQVMVLGTLGPCGAAGSLDSPSVQHAAAIYDSVTGALRKVIPLEPLLGLDPAGLPRWLRRGSVSFFGLGWSPTGTHLAFVYTAFDSAMRISPDDVLDSGLLLVDADQGTGTAIRGDSAFFATIGGASGGFPVWNVARGTEAPAGAPAVGLAYSWNGGQPQPLAPIHGPVAQLPIDAGPRYPVGNPDGGATFTIWQPGLVAGPGSARLSSGQAVFLTAFPSWSTDGAYVTLIIAGAALPAPTASVGATDGVPLPLPTPATFAEAPARDAALDAVQQQVGRYGWALVAWNPAGTLLASVNCLTSGGEQLELRDANAGSTTSTAALALGPGDGGCRDAIHSRTVGAYPNAPLALLWSPTGDRVLVSDRTAGTLTLWPVSHPAAPTA